MMSLTWILQPFSNLTPHQLYAALQLRNEVFVVEQACVFQDADDKDQGCYHLLGYSAGKLVGYTRLVPPHHIYEQPSIGRVVIAPASRSQGIGRELMSQSILQLQALYGKLPIKIGAQLYLKKFYESFDFVQSGEGYIEDGIPHIHMIKIT